MAHGCPVVAANAASIPEVCGDAAVYFDPRDAQSFLTALNSVMTQPALQQKLQVNARTRSEHWSWARAAQTLHDGLLRALKTKQ
jgi:glycosyltransferase involved in cell wall biosynthesis